MNKPSQEIGHCDFWDEEKAGFDPAAIFSEANRPWAIGILATAIVLIVIALLTYMKIIT